MSEQISKRFDELMKQFFSDWQVVELLGEGSYAKVYKIKRVQTEETSALKWITYTEKDAISAMQNRGVSPDAIKNYCIHTQRLLENEIKTLKSLNDSVNIVRMNEYHTVANDGGSFDMLIRMEMLTPLHKRLPVMRVKDVISMGKDICTALCDCEQANVVHRDIKPENIFCDDAGCYKLGDFGVATSLYGGKKAKTQRGTPLYMAPEVYEGKPYDARVDICSLGLVLYECLNRCLPPFMYVDGSSVTPEMENDALEKRMSDEEEMIGPTQADTDLSEIVLKACAYEAEDRYSNAREFLEALESLADRPEYESKIILYTAESEPETKPKQNPNETVKGLPRHTLELTQRIDNGTVTDDDKPEEPEDEAEDIVEAKDENSSVQKENPFEIQRQKKKALIKKCVIIGSIVLAVCLVILFIVLVMVNKASYDGLKLQTSGMGSDIVWENGGSGPWNVKVKLNDAVMAETVTEDRDVSMYLAPGYTYTVDVDGEISGEFTVPEKPAYSGEMTIHWVRLCKYDVKQGTQLKDYPSTECTSITSDPLIGQPGQAGYMLKGCVELPEGMRKDISCYIISDFGMTSETVQVEGPEVGFSFFYIPLNDFIREKCLNAEKLTLKLYSEDMSLYNKIFEIN